MFNRGDRNIKRCLSGLDGGSGSNRGRSLRVGAKKDVELLPGVVDCTLVDEPLLASFQCLGGRTIGQTNLLVRPDGLDLLRVRHADVSVTTEFCPVLRALDVELSESLVDSLGEASDLLSRVTGGDGEPETFLATSNGGVVDGLDVDVVLGEQFIGGSLSESGITDEDRDDVRRTGDNRNIKLLEARLQITNVDLLELTITVVLALIRNTSTSTSHVDGRKRGGEDETSSVRANHVDHISRASDIATDCAVSLAESTWRNKVI